MHTLQVIFQTHQTHPCQSLRDAHLPQSTTSMMLVTRTSCPSPRAMAKNKMILEGCQRDRQTKSARKSATKCAAEALKNSYKIKYEMNLPGSGVFVETIMILASVWTHISSSQGFVLLFSTGPPTNFTLVIVKGSSKTLRGINKTTESTGGWFQLFQPQKNQVQLVGSQVTSCQVCRVHSRCSPGIQALSESSPHRRWFPPVKVYIDLENPLFPHVPSVKSDGFPHLCYFTPG